MAIQKIKKTDFDTLLQVIIKQAKEIGIPVPNNIRSHVNVNTRAKGRFGCCRRQFGEFQIEISSIMKETNITNIKNTLAHEILHTLEGCFNHGPKWKCYALKMNWKYGYCISRTTTSAALGITETKVAKKANYIIKCKTCDMETPRTKATPVTQKPWKYKCKCGGELMVIRTARR